MTARAGSGPGRPGPEAKAAAAGLGPHAATASGTRPLPVPACQSGRLAEAATEPLSLSRLVGADTVVLLLVWEGSGES